MTTLPELIPRSKVWFERNGQVALSDWRVQLLERVDATGSLAEAARQMDVPYKTAWYKLKEVESALGVEILRTTTGGPHGGSAALTPAGRDILRRYHQVVGDLEDLVKQRYAEFFAGAPSLPSP